MQRSVFPSLTSFRPLILCTLALLATTACSGTSEWLDSEKAKFSDKPAKGSAEQIASVNGERRKPALNPGGGGSTGMPALSEPKAPQAMAAPAASVKTSAKTESLPAFDGAPVSGPNAAAVASNTAPQTAQAPQASGGWFSNAESPSERRRPAMNAPEATMGQPAAAYPSLSTVPNAPTSFTSTASVKQDIRSLEYERDATKQAAGMATAGAAAMPVAAPVSDTPAFLSAEPAALPAKGKTVALKPQFETSALPPALPEQGAPVKPLTISEPLPPIAGAKPVALKPQSKSPIPAGPAAKRGELAPVDSVAVGDAAIAGAEPIRLTPPTESIQLRQPEAWQAAAPVRAIPESRYASRRASERAGSDQ